MTRSIPFVAAALTLVGAQFIASSATSKSEGENLNLNGYLGLSAPTYKPEDKISNEMQHKTTIETEFKLLILNTFKANHTCSSFVETNEFETIYIPNGYINMPVLRCISP